MKKILLLSFFCSIFLQAFGQLKGHCGFVATDDFIQRTLENKKHYDQYLMETRSPEIRYIPINFIITGSTNGNQVAAKEEKVLDMLCRLNETYLEGNIQFYIKNGFEYIYNDNVYDNPGLANALFITPSREPQAMDVLIGKNASSGGSLGITLGHYNPNTDWIVIKTSEVNYSSETFPHEVGHYLSLNHPHNGWDNDPYDEAVHGNPVSITSSPTNSSIPIELANGSNCETSGDFLCDTPADYNLGFGWPNCNYDGGVMDPQGTPLNPDENNFMGYFLECANDYSFTDQQMALVNADVDYRTTIDNSLNISDWSPIATSIDGEVSMEFPADNETLEYFNNFELKWNLPEGASRSLIEISENFLFLTTHFKDIVYGNSMWVDSDFLSPNKQYYVRIRPFNDYVTCTAFSDSFTFTTGLSTNTEEPVVDLNWSVAPNPIMGGSSVRVYGDFENSTDLNIQLISSAGQVIEEQFKSAQPGSFFTTLNTSDLSAGVYFVRLNTTAGVSVKKLIVQ